MKKYQRPNTQYENPPPLKNQNYPYPNNNIESNN